MTRRYRIVASLAVALFVSGANLISVHAQSNDEWSGVTARAASAVVRVEATVFNADGTIATFSSGMHGPSNNPTAGTGFLVSQSGALVTAAHVIPVVKKGQTREIWIYPTRASDQRISATELLRLSDVDVILLQVSGTRTWSFLSFARSADAVEGQGIAFVGYPSGTYAPSIGTIVNARDQKQWLTRLSTGLGASGGPIINRCGQVLGIVSYSVTGREHTTTDVVPEALFYQLIHRHLPPATTVDRACGPIASYPSSPQPLRSKEQIAQIPGLDQRRLAECFMVITPRTERFIFRNVCLTADFPPDVQRDLEGIFDIERKKGF